MPSMPPTYGRKKAIGKQFKPKPNPYDWAWRKLRERRLDEEPLCRHCAEKGFVTPAEQVDHILPTALGGKNTWDNTQSLCKPCHREKTNHDIKRIRGTL